MKTITFKVSMIIVQEYDDEKLRADVAHEQAMDAILDQMKGVTGKVLVTVSTADDKK